MKKGFKIGVVILIIVIFIVVGLVIIGNKEKGNSYSNNVISSDSKALVLYFSWGGTTEKVAKEIAHYTSADIEKVTEVDSYTKDYNKLTEIAQKEKEDNVRPKYNKLKHNIQDYDIVFVGYPIWWMDMPMIMYNLFESEDFSGKTVIPFMTSYSSGESGTTEEIQGILKNSKVVKGLHIYDDDMDNYKKTTDDYLKSLGFTK